jgi:hypothetical protein
VENFKKHLVHWWNYIWFVCGSTHMKAILSSCQIASYYFTIDVPNMEDEENVWNFF